MCSQIDYEIIGIWFSDKLQTWMSSYYSRCIISWSSGRGSFNGKGHGKTFPERTGIAMSNPHPAWEGKMFTYLPCQGKNQSSSQILKMLQSKDR